MPTPEDWKFETLREALAWAHKEARRDRLKRSEISHRLANGFMTMLVVQGAHIIETGSGNANYFFMDVAGKTMGISPFASHEEWWEKPSDGFRAAIKRHSCDWGVVLFLLPKREGIWIEGKTFDEVVLKDREKVNASEVHFAIHKGVATPFSEPSEFLAILKARPRPRAPFLISKG